MCCERPAEIDTERYRFGITQAEGELHVDEDDPHEDCREAQATLWKTGEWQ